MGSKGCSQPRIAYGMFLPCQPTFSVSRQSVPTLHDPRGPITAPKRGQIPPKERDFPLSQNKWISIEERVTLSQSEGWISEIDQ